MKLKKLIIMLGAGRVVYQDLVKINHACEDNSILENPEIISAYSYAQTTGKSLHLMGLQQPEEMTGRCLINE
jgi:bisphosphoglycerate-independent phosphoglycerate mutase (AlkP superfamily)